MLRTKKTGRLIGARPAASSMGTARMGMMAMLIDPLTSVKRMMASPPAAPHREFIEETQAAWSGENPTPSSTSGPQNVRKKVDMELAI